MENPKIEFPELAGKVLAELSIYDDTLYGREAWSALRMKRSCPLRSG